VGTGIHISKKHKLKYDRQLENYDTFSMIFFLMCINFSFKRKQEPGQNKRRFRSEKKLKLLNTDMNFSSVADPDSHGFAFSLVGAGSGSAIEYGSGFRRAKMTHKSEENSSFEVLDVFF
jgi:hypothetical protein